MHGHGPGHTSEHTGRELLQVLQVYNRLDPSWRFYTISPFCPHTKLRLREVRLLAQQDPRSSSRFEIQPCSVSPGSPAPDLEVALPLLLRTSRHAVRDPARVEDETQGVERWYCVCRSRLRLDTRRRQEIERGTSPLVLMEGSIRWWSLLMNFLFQDRSKCTEELRRQFIGVHTHPTAFPTLHVITCDCHG